ncbi:MAG TPA: hypothetical protein VEN99_04005 [Acidimicrobiia bacterium]|nr:hypothetical protein [Acidimicrobiia bacterium]
MAGPQRFFDPSQPQTLQIATILLYMEAVFAFLLMISVPIPIVFAAACAGAAYGMANGKKWGYGLALVVAVVRLINLVFGTSIDVVLRIHTIDLMFAVALLALVLHPQSRQYQKIWFS